MHPRDRRWLAAACVFLLFAGVVGIRALTEPKNDLKNDLKTSEPKTGDPKTGDLKTGELKAGDLKASEAKTAANAILRTTTAALVSPS